MTENHPITPPPELVEQWMHEASGQPPGPDARVIATQAARWGDEQRLEACIAWLHYNYPPVNCEALRAAMHPKPPSLAEEALTSLSHLKIDLRQFGLGSGNNDIHTIRAALERLQELEQFSDDQG